MKTLTKIKLVNWHGFFDDTIEIKGSTLITGENGCGKSTLIDAIYFLLTGGDTDQFNAAANDNQKASRTLETYMQGKTGVEGKELLRGEANVISHIALEFYNEEERNYFVIGVVLEIQDGKNVNKTFYHLPKRMVTDELFFSEKESGRACLNYHSMQKKIGESNINSLGRVKKEVKKAILSILSLEGRNYYELLPKALSFSRITDIEDFVRNFLMPEKQVDIENIRENIRTYNELQAKINADKEKKDALEIIIQKGERWTALSLEEKLLKAYEFKKEIEIAEEELEKLQKRYEALYEQSKEQKNLEKNIDSEIESLQEEIYSLTHSQAYLAIQQLDSEIKVAEEKKEELTKKVSELNNAILFEVKIAELLNIEVDFQKYIKNKKHQEFLIALGQYQNAYNRSFAALCDRIAALQIECSQLEQKVKELSAIKDQLNQGLPSYPNSVKALIEVIQYGIKQEIGEDVRAIPFCELINIANGEEEWRNAVEGYLNTRRFDLFVPQKYYDIALRLYEKYKYERKIYGVGLVNTAKLKDGESMPDSLATKVTSEHTEAQKYVRFLLGKIICVESENDLKLHESSITKTVMVYQNKAARQTKKDVYDTPYIGAEARRIRLKRIEEELAEASQTLSEKSDEKAQKNRIRERVQRSKREVLKSFENVWGRLDLVCENLASLYQRKEEAKKNENTLFADVERQEKLLDVKKANKNAYQEKWANLQKQIGGIETQIADKQSQLDRKSPNFELILRDTEIQANLETYCIENPYSLAQIREKANSATREIEGLNHTLKGVMQEYINQFSFDATAELDSLPVFAQEYHQVVMRDLERYGERLEEVKAMASVTFQNSYIAEIRKHIKDEKENIRKLNQTLADKPFGVDGEVYKFEISRSKDSNFAEYYDIFIGNEDYEIRDLITSQLSDKHAQLMQELFFRLTSETRDSKQEELIKKYTDYRRFMSYDIKITNKRGEESYFSKINKEKSGGETQTPFYVIIAASFDQIVHNRYSKQSSACVIMMDEAFNNMDGSRIDSMLQYFEQLQIQPIIIVPTPRAKPIMPYVQTTVGLVKNNHRIIPRVMIKEQK